MGRWRTYHQFGGDVGALREAAGRFATIARELQALADAREHEAEDAES